MNMTGQNAADGIKNPIKSYCIFYIIMNGE